MTETETDQKHQICIISQMKSLVGLGLKMQAHTMKVSSVHCSLNLVAAIWNGSSLQGALEIGA